MFSQASVKNSVHRGVCLPDTPPTGQTRWTPSLAGRHPLPANTPLGRHPLGRRPRWADIPLPPETPLGRHPPGQTPWTDTPWADTLPEQTPPSQTPPPQQTATAADCTHPTGMHSCLQQDVPLLTRMNTQIFVQFNRFLLNFEHSK